MARWIAVLCLVAGMCNKMWSVFFLLFSFICIYTHSSCRCAVLCAWYNGLCGCSSLGCSAVIDSAFSKWGKIFGMYILYLLMSFILGSAEITVSLVSLLFCVCVCVLEAIRSKLSGAHSVRHDNAVLFPRAARN